MGWKGNKLKGKKKKKKMGRENRGWLEELKKKKRFRKKFFLNNLEEVQRWTKVFGPLLLLKSQLEVSATHSKY